MSDQEGVTTKANPEASVPVPAGPMIPKKPGDIDIRPSREEAETDKASFYDWLRRVRTLTGLTHEEMGEVLGWQGNIPSNMSKRIKNKTLEEEEKSKLLKYVFEQQNLLSGQTRHNLRLVRDAFHFSFLNYFDTKETSQDSARALLVGTYELWRYSIEHEGEYVLGRLDIWEDPDTRALRVKMIQKRKAGTGMRRIRERFYGYMFRASHMYLMLLRDRITKDFRITLFPRFKPDYVGTKINPRSMFLGKRNHIVQMDGFGLGVDGKTAFFSPVHVALVDDMDHYNRLDEMLDVMPENDARLPPRIVAKLKSEGPLQRL